MIIIFIVLILLAGAAAVVIGIIRLSSRSKPAQNLHGPKSVQERLAEIDGLRSRHLISETEYEEKRKQILDEI